MILGERQPLEHEHVGADHHLGATVDDVVGGVRVHRRAHLCLTGLQRGEEPEQRAHVVALGEALAAHQPARLEHRVGEQEAVGGHEVDARVLGPAAEHRLQQARNRALPGRDAAADTDHVRHACVQMAEERLGDDAQVASRREAQVQQPREREVNLFDLAHLERFAAATQRLDVGLAERQRRRRAQCAPLRAIEVDVRAQLRSLSRAARHARRRYRCSALRPVSCGRGRWGS